MDIYLIKFKCLLICFPFFKTVIIRLEKNSRYSGNDLFYLVIFQL